MSEQQKSKVSEVFCHVCASPAVDPIPGYELFRRVTSDCQPWHKGGRLYACRACECVQKMTDQVWRCEVEEIYQAYSIYRQADGAEQAVFDVDSGQPLSRSVRLLECVYSKVQLPETGRLLDLGAGNGALLRSFSRLFPTWSLAATELNDKYRLVIESIVGVEALYTCPLDQIPGTFNLITMIHVLEHITAPGDFLATLWSKLDFRGLLVVQIPNYLQNPFDLLIADHCTHFTVATASALIQSLGFEVISVGSDWVPKELTIVARKTEQKSKIHMHVSTVNPVASAARSLQWLETVVTTARGLATLGNFGLFGTSIAATWLFTELEGMVDFFLDEDPNRLGKTYMGRPVLHPCHAPQGSRVLIALPTEIAESIKTRMLSLRMNLEWYVPTI